MGALKSIGDGAFLDCHSLKSVTIPKNVETIGQYAFGYKSVNDGQSAVLIADFVMNVIEGSSAEKYAKSNDVDYKAADSGLKKVVFIVICVGAVILISVIVVVIVRKDKKKPETEAKKVEEEEPIDEEGYESILGEESSENEEYIAEESEDE